MTAAENWTGSAGRVLAVPAATLQKSGRNQNLVFDVNGKHRWCSVCLCEKDSTFSLKFARLSSEIKSATQVALFISFDKQRWKKWKPSKNLSK